MLPPLTTLFALALLLPGLVWQVGFGVGQTAPSYDIASRFADLIGISLALAALVGLGTFLFGGRFSGTAILWLYGLMGVTLLLFFLQRRKKDLLPEPATPHAPRLIPHLSLITFLLLLAFRFYQARTLVLPPWVDSVHHTLLVRLFLETGGVPPTAAPYLPVTLYYHFGFHLNAALFAFFTHLTPDQAVLIFGQILNAFVSLAMYRLAMALWHDPRRALLALLLTGFVSQMPAYYLTWGRYTLLTGLSLMLLAMSAALDVIRNPSPNPEAAARLALYITGTLLTHYFAAGLLALFLGVLVFEQMFASRWQVWQHPGVRTLFWAGFIGFLLASPWVWHVWVSGQRYISVSVVSPTNSPDETYFSGYIGYLWQLMGPYRGHVFLVLGGIAFLLLGWRTRVRPFALWTVAFIFVSLPWGIHLQPFRPDHGVIVAFLPAGMMLADAFITPLDAESRWFRWLARGTFALALISLLIWGVRETRDILNPGTILASQADVHALTWIAENTPADADFFINVAYWQSGSYRGVDGGWWIMPLTGRRTFLPPALFLFGPKDQVLATNALAAHAVQFNACTDEFRMFLAENKLTYVYLGANQGPLRPEGMASCSDFQVVYAQEGVTIYQVP